MKMFAKNVLQSALIIALILGAMIVVGTYIFGGLWFTLWGIDLFAMQYEWSFWIKTLVRLLFLVSWGSIILAIPVTIEERKEKKRKLLEEARSQSERNHRQRKWHELKEDKE